MAIFFCKCTASLQSTVCICRDRIGVAQWLGWWLRRSDYRLGVSSIPSWGTFLHFFTNQLVISLNFEVIILLLKYIIKLGRRPVSVKRSFTETGRRPNLPFQVLSLLIFLKWPKLFNYAKSFSLALIKMQALRLELRVLLFISKYLTSGFAAVS